MTNPKTIVSFDYAIKYLLKNKGDYDIVEGFISAILSTQGYLPVKINALLDSESNKEDPYLKRSIADLIVEDTKGSKYIIEISRDYSAHFLHKACFNTSRLIVDSIYGNEDYSTIKKVLHISLLYFKWGTTPVHHGKTIMKEINLHLATQGGQILDIHNVFPEYFVISVPLFDDVIKLEIDEWLYVMKHSSTKDEFKSPYMKKVADRLTIIKMNVDEQEAYYKYMNETLKQRDYIEGAEEKGEKRGIEKGREEGREEREIEIAKNLLLSGADINLISSVTGLPNSEIEKLKK